MSLISINPTTGKQIETYKELSLEEACEIVDLSHEMSKAWGRMGFEFRAECMKAAGQILRSKRQSLSQLMAREMGKPVTQGLAEIDKCALTCYYFAENAEHFLKPKIIQTEAEKSYVAYEPLGVILAIMPWNFPFWQVFRAAVPALMAGNAVLLKHASNVPGCALAIEAIFREAGFPEEIFRSLLISSKTALSLIEDEHIHGVTLTGSTEAGRSVASRAGQFLKKCVLELGGSDPYVILEDANLETAASLCAISRLQNSGQSCIAAKRMIVVESVYDQFVELFMDHMTRPIIGDPLLEQTTMGPLARHDLREKLHIQVQQSLKQGAVCLLGGSIPEGPGAFYPPTILTKVFKGMPAYDEELFGPVAALICAQDEQDAIRIANDTPFGLGAAVFTQDKKRGEEIALKELEAGSGFVNTFVKSDPRLPFGGIKGSGFGRELSHVGIKEFVNCKTVLVGAS